MAGSLAAGQGLYSLYSPLLLLHHACSCSPAAAGVLSSQLPAPNPLHKEKTARTITPFFSFFLLYTNIYRVLYTSLHRQCHSEHTALCGQGPDSHSGSPRAWLYLQRPQHPSPLAGPGARAVGGCKKREAGSTSPLPQPADRADWELSALMLVSFLAATWRGWATVSIPLHTHVCSSPS